MRNTIKYYYDIEVDEISFDGQNYVFDKYILKKLNKKINYDIYNYLIFNNFLIYKIITNKYNSLETTINNEKYILLLKNNNLAVSSELILLSYKKLNMKYKINWNELWIKKIDYYEKIAMKYKNVESINNYFPYYIGLSENAIQYFNENNGNYTLSFTHYRICSKLDFFSPDNYLIDNIARDLSEYIKYCFFIQDKEIKDKDISNLFSKVSLSKDEYILLFSRLLFPTYFFDCLECENDIKIYISKMNQYEKLLINVYFIIKQRNDIPIVDWLIKKYR